MGDNSTLANTLTMWEQSNPSVVGSNGRTVSGLWRVFRSARLSADVDEYGYHKSDEAEKQILEEREMLEKMSDWDGLSGQKRKFPLTIEDVFAPSSNDCVLFPALLSGRLFYLKQEKDEKRGIYIQSRIAKAGNLSWKNNVFGGEVVWTEDPKGKWQISQHPLNPNAKHRGESGKASPVMGGAYTFGADPIDTMTDGKIMTRTGTMTRSYGAGAVFRLYDDLADGDLEKDEFGEIIETELMYSQQYVCDYQDRPDDPDEYCEDMLMTAIYFSCPVFCEKNKPSVDLYFRRHGFVNYLMDRPTETKSNPRTRKKHEKGANATQPLIRTYTDALKVQVYNRIGTFWHPRILTCHAKYNVANRGQRDLTVAAGFSLLGEMKFGSKKAIDKAKDDWGLFIHKRYKYNTPYLASS